MTFAPQIKVPATYIRGGTSKGVFFKLQDLPLAAQVPGPARDALLMRVIGSPDPYGKQTDGMGAATSSTSKTVILSKSTQPDHDIDYLFGQVSIDKPFVDWSGNCGNLTAAVGPFGISNGLVDPSRIPQNGHAVIRIWQANIGKTIVAHVPMTNGAVQETGDFELDGVTFPAAEVQLEFMDPAADEEGTGGSMFPTGNVVDELNVPGVGSFKVTMINAGIPTIFVNAEDIGYRGTELQDDINSDPKALTMFETIRAYGAVRMGLISDIAEAATRQHTPKVAFVAKPADYVSSSGKNVSTSDVNVLVRAMSMGKLHHAMMGTAAVAIGTAAAIPGTLVNLAAGGGNLESIRFGHPSGTLRVGAQASQVDGEAGSGFPVISSKVCQLVSVYRHSSIFYTRQRVSPPTTRALMPDTLPAALKANHLFKHPYLEGRAYSQYPLNLRMEILLDYFIRLVFPKSTVWLAANSNRLLAHVNPKAIPMDVKWPIVGLWGSCLIGTPVMRLKMNQDISHDRLNSRFTTLVDGHACVLTYTLNGRTASFDHTGVPDAVGGRGIAAALTKFSLDTARDEGWQKFTYEDILSTQIWYWDKTDLFFVENVKTSIF
eukprot:gene588-590_t